MIYTRLWRNKWLTSDARTIDDMIEGLESAATLLKAMRDAGVQLADTGSTADDYALLLVEDAEVARRFAFEEEFEEQQESEEQA